MKKLIILIIAIFTINVANAQWQHIGLDSFSVRRLIINGNNIFAGTALQGVFLSTDNGNTWACKMNGLPNNAFDFYTIAIKDSNIYIGTDGETETNLFTSTDNGDNWVADNNRITNNTYVKSLFVSGNNIFAGTGVGVFLSTNNGNNWIPANTGIPVVGSSSVPVNTFAEKDSMIFAGTLGDYIYLSSNNGSSWAAMGSGVSSAYVWLISISGDTIYAGTGEGSDYGGLFMSVNNGNNWSLVNIGIPSSCTIVYAIAIKDSMIFVGTNNYGVIMSTDNGGNWVQMNAGFTDLDIWCLAISGDYIFAGTRLSGLWRRSISEILGIKENNLNNNFTIYPNPTKDNLTIETNSNKEQKIEITNLIGQTVYTTIINKKATINTSAFAKGVYILKLSSDKETVVRKFVKE